MLNLQNKLIFFKFKNDSLGKLYYCINDIVLHIYNLDGSNRDFRRINNLNLIRDQIEIIDYDVALSILGNDFNIAYNLYNNRDSNNNEILELKKRRLYRILDEKDIEFMNTDFYQKYPLIFNLILGIKSFEYKDEKNNYYFARISPFKSIPDCEFVKIPEKDVLSRAIRTDCDYEHNISSFALDILLNDEEKEYFKKFFKITYKKGDFCVGQFYKYMESEDLKERSCKSYLRYSELYEKILGIFVVSFINEDSIILSKLDYYQYQSAYDFHFELSYEEFNNMNFEILDKNYETYVDEILKKIYFRSRDIRLARKWKL